MAAPPESMSASDSDRAPEARRLRLVALRTSLVVWIGGLLYIALSDRAIDLWMDDPELTLRVQTIKGWVFVTVMSAVIYIGLRSQFFRIEREVRERRRAEEALRTRIA